MGREKNLHDDLGMELASGMNEKPMLHHWRIAFKE